MDKPNPETVLKMLNDIESVVKSRFYEDPDPIASPIEMFRMPEGKPGGERFDDLSPPEKWQVLGDYTHWQDYERGGIGMEMLDQVFSNVIKGEPRSEWLAGTEDWLRGDCSPSERWTEWDEMLADAALRFMPERDDEKER